ncbi:hypothetical protein ABZT08_13445 [Streptomyces sp. NPDC005526]|uniref:hypothetical protein n=1 Tax=Streptomyces sp. NPDC005526 TaxID=3156885 RepID=UPI0033A28191
MSDSRKEDEAAVNAVPATYKAWEANDLDGVVANYTKDATAILPGARSPTAVT